MTLDPTAVLKERWADGKGFSGKPWFEETKEDAYKSVLQHTQLLAGKQRTKAIMDRHHLKLYGNGDVAGTGITDSTLADIIRGEDGRMRYLLCTSIVDSAVPVITSNKPIPYYATEGGSFSDQRKARKRTKALQGQYFDLGLYEVAPLIARDAMILGNGYLWGSVNKHTGLPELERVQPQQILIDHVENVAGDVRSIYRFRPVSRFKLMRLFPEHAKALETAAGPTVTEMSDWFVTQDGTADLVMVIEAIHLPSIKKQPFGEDESETKEDEEAEDEKSDGRRLLITSTCTLEDEEWTDDEFPVSRMVWKNRAVGTWLGCGLVEETKAPQMRINRLIRHQETIQNITAKVWIMLEKGSQVAPAAMVAGSSVPVQVIEYVGMQPQFYQHPSGSVDIREEIQAIKLETMEQVGLNSQQMQGDKPSGVDSGIALQTMEDIGSRRYIENVRQYERFFMQTARLLERLNDRASKMAEEKGLHYYVNSVDHRGKQEVLNRFEWKDLAITGQSTMRMYPINSLPSTPAGKWERVTQWLNTGFLTRPWAMKLLDVPDLDEALSLELVDLDTVLWHVEQILDGESGIVPTPYQDLELTVEVVRKAWLKADMLGADEPTLNALTAYQNMARRMLKEAQAEAAVASAPPAQPAMPQDPMAPFVPANPAAMGAQA